MRFLLIAGFFCLSACASTPPAPEITVVDLPTYRTYLVEMRNALANADARSFEPGEQEKLSALSGQLLASLEDVESLDSLTADQLTSVLNLNDQLHLAIVGENDSRASGRVCTTMVPVGSNIRKTTCRSRAQIASDRQSSRDLLDQRTRDREREALMLEQEISIDGSGGFRHIPLGSG